MLLELFPIDWSFGCGYVVRRIHESLELSIGHFIDIDEEPIDGHVMNGAFIISRLFAIASHLEGATIEPDHAIWCRWIPFRRSDDGGGMVGGHLRGGHQQYQKGQQDHSNGLLKRADSGSQE